jgi:hypothetical protein
MPALRTLPLAAAIACAALALAPTGTRAGAQAEESLAPSVATVLSRSISDRPVPVDWETRADAREWIGEMGRRIAPRLPDEAERREILRWLLWDNHKFTSYTATFRFLRALAKDPDPAVVDEFGRRARAAWAVLDHHLAGRSWIVAGRPTIVDLSCSG